LTEVAKRTYRPSDGTFLKVAVWSTSIICALALLPAALATVWVPGCYVCHSDEDFHSETEVRAHSDVSCIDCHGGTSVTAQWQFRQKVMYQMALPFGNLSGNPQTVANANCLSCHTAVFEETIFNNGLFMNHRDGATEQRCADCHSTVAHGIQSRFPRTYDMNDCLLCHMQHSKLMGETNDCSLCHEGNHQSVGVTQVRMTHGSEWRITHAMGNLETCWACHPQDYCVRCHGIGYPHNSGYLNLHGADATDPGQDCSSCHRNTQWCHDCHGGHEMPHPNNFLRDHASIATHVINDESCLICHIRSDCADCHAAHAHPGGSFTPASRYPYR